MVSDEWLSRFNTKFEISEAVRKYRLLILIHEEYEDTVPNDSVLDSLQQHLKALKTKALLMGIQLEE